MEPLASRLKDLRETRGLSHARLSLEMGGALSDQSLINIEKGRQIPKADALAAMTRALTVSADYLLGLDDDPHPRWAILTPEQRAAETLAEMVGEGP